MPTRNRGDRIYKSISSVLNQTINDIELVIVDNNSAPDDRTQQVITEINDHRIKYFNTAMPNISTARNYGNMMANSEVIAVTDSDDISSQERAKSILDSLQKYQWDIFYSGFEVFDEKNKSLTLGKYPVKQFDPVLLKTSNYIAHSSSSYLKNIAMDFPYNSFFEMAEDYDLFTRLLNNNKKFYFCPEILVRYVVHDNNITQGKSLPNYKHLIQLNRGWLDEDRTTNTDEILKIVTKNSKQK